MRFVPNPGGAPAPPELLPSADRLEGARSLRRRFPQAELAEAIVVRSPVPLSAARPWLAIDAMQVTGSFKVRGALVAVAARLEAARASGAPLRIVAASAGNHGAGVAYAASVLGAEATVVVPRGAPRAKVDTIARHGARVVVADADGYDEAEEQALALAAAEGAAFLSPYDDLDVLAGNGASLAFEVARAIGRVPSSVLCPIGGGGLATGLACGLSHEAGEAPAPSRVVGVQSEASPAFALSLERGSAVTALPAAATLADGLEGGISGPAFARARAVLAGAYVASEDEVGRAMAFAYRELGLVLEGSAAVALAPLLVPGARPSRDEDEVVVLTGRNVDPRKLAEVVERWAPGGERAT